MTRSLDAVGFDLCAPEGVFRGLRTCVRLMWRAAPGLTIVVGVGVPILESSFSLQALWIRNLVDSAVDRNLHAALLWAGLVTINQLVSILVVACALNLEYTLGEKVALLADRRVAELAGTMPDLSLHEDPEDQDRMELLAKPDTFRTLVMIVPLLLGQLIGAGVTLALVGWIHPLLLLELVLVLPGALVGVRSRALVRAAEERAAPASREQRHWFRAATDPEWNKELRLHDDGRIALELHRQAGERARDERMRGQWKAIRHNLVAALGTNLGFGMALVFVVYLVRDGRASAGDIALIGIVLFQLASLINSFYNLMNWLLDARNTVDRFIWLHERVAAARRLISRGSPAGLSINGSLRFENVCFAYPRTETEVLEGIDLEVPAGSTLAIVGSNGAGKTTLSKLVARLYEPTAGRILFGGVDIADLDIDGWRGRVSACFQDAARFEIRAGEAVGIGDLDRFDDHESIDEALRASLATEFVAALPNGVESQLGATWPAGIDLSGGQWQRLGLARASMRGEALVTILDEPSSALDAQTEHQLFEAARQLGGASTSRRGILILVSHRFTTVRMADLIIVIEDGRISERGTHVELMQRDGTYARLYRIQEAGYAEAEDGIG